MAAGVSCLTVRVAFAGPRDLKDRGDVLQERLKSVFEDIAKAVTTMAGTEIGQHETVLDAHSSVLKAHAARPFDITLMLGFAAGADRLAARVWQDGQFGLVHAVFPFKDAREEHASEVAWTHGPNEWKDEFRVDLGRPDGLKAGFDHVTVLDGKASAEEHPPRDGHLEQSRFLVRWSDLCVVAWDGALPSGLGGTGDLVAFALRKRMPIIWVDLSADDLPVRWILPDTLWAQVHFGEFVSSISRGAVRQTVAPPFDTSDLVSELTELFAPPGPARPNGETAHKKAMEDEKEKDVDEAKQRLRYVKGLKAPFAWWLVRFLAWIWQKHYRRFGSPPARAPLPPAIELDPLVEQEFRRADDKASTVGNAHRAAQSIILVLSIVAVIFALLPVFDSERKALYVFCELILIIFMSTVRYMLHGLESHRVWSDVRRLAERLRVLRATWPLAFDVADSVTHASDTWTEWYARAIRRAVGPQGSHPSAARPNVRVLDQTRKKRALIFAQDDPEGIVDNQRVYNATTAVRSLKMHHRLEKIEAYVLVLLITSLALFLFVYMLGVFGIGSKPNKLWGDVILTVSAVFPLIAAVCMAVEAKLGLHENGLKASALRHRFAAIHGQMSKDSNPTRDIELLEEAAIALLDDVDGWREGAVRRTATTI